MRGTYYSKKSELHISATNLQEFKELIEKADQEARQLMDTIEKLEQYQIVIGFSEKITEKEEDIDKYII